MKNYTPPTEQQEQEAFVAWCRSQGYRLHHSPNEVGGSSQAMKIRAIKMKKMGTSKGFPDLLIFVPFRVCKGCEEAIKAVKEIVGGLDNEI